MSIKGMKEEQKKTAKGLVYIGIIFALGCGYGTLRTKSKIANEYVRILETIGTDK